MAIEPRYLFGLDLGQSSDPSALVLLRETRTGPLSDAFYEAIYLYRWPLQTPYTVIATETQAYRRRVAQHGETALVVDGTGVGRGPVDLLRALGEDFVPVTIHGGRAVSSTADGYRHVPKRDLVGVVTLLLQQRRLRVSGSLAECPSLVTELRQFKATIGPSGHDSYGASADGALADDWRGTGPHDDLVLATALAAWYGEHGAGSVGCMSWERPAGLEDDWELFRQLGGRVPSDVRRPMQKNPAEIEARLHPPAAEPVTEAAAAAAARIDWGAAILDRDGR